MRNGFRLIAVVSLMTVFCYTNTVRAEDECYWSDDCPGPRLCMDLECLGSSTPLTECETEDQCDFNEICHSGVCKNDGVACSNLAGYCYQDNDWGECNCYSGDGTGWGGGTGNMYTGAELYEICVTDLVEFCGEEAPEVPDPEDYCEDEQQEQYCVDLMTKYIYLDSFCYGGDFYDPNPWNIAECCEALNSDDGDYIQTIMDCILELDDEDCEGYAACMPEDDYDTDDYGDTGGDDPDEDDYYDDGDPDEDDNTDTSTEETTPPADEAQPEGYQNNGCVVVRVGQTDSMNLVTVITALFN